MNCRKLVPPVLLALMVSAPQILAAQVDPDSINHRNNCRLAAQVVETGQPPTKKDWALSYIGTCGEGGGEVLAQVLDELRTSNDIERLDEIGHAVAWRLRDGHVYGMAYDIAQDDAASPPARVTAIGLLIGLVYSGAVYSHHQLASGEPGSCISGSLHYQGVEGAPLPEDYSRRILELGEVLERDEAQPTEVRNAALCIWVVHPDAARPGGTQ